MACPGDVFDADAEAAAELVVITELDITPMYPIEIKPRPGQSPEEIKEAVERCETTCWIKIGPSRGPDPRAHLTAAGTTELGLAAQTRAIEIEL